MDEAGSVNQQPQHEEAISLLDIAIVLARHKKLILGIPFIAAVAAAVVSLVMTPIYTASTKILPPQQQQSTAAAVLGQLGALGGAAGSVTGIKNPADVYVGMLKSRTIADNLIQRFDLLRRYEVKLWSDARNALGNDARIAVGKDGIITIEVDDSDPKIAAALANAYVYELTKLTAGFAVTEAGQRRLFLEKQLKATKDKFVAAEMAARNALTQGGIAMVAEQGRSMVETTAALRAQLAAKEVQIGAMKTFAAEQNPDYQKALNELGALKQQITKLEGANQGAMSHKKGGTSGEGLRNLGLLRDVKYYEVLFDLLAKQYELAKIDEAKEGAVIQVLDEATEPDRRSKPKRTLIVVLTALFSGVAAVLLAFVVQAGETAMRDSRRAEQLAILRKSLWQSGRRAR